LCVKTQQETRYKMVEHNCNPPLNYAIPTEDWEHVFALSRKYPLLTIYQMFMDVHPESRNFE